VVWYHAPAGDGIRRNRLQWLMIPGDTGVRTMEPQDLAEHLDAVLSLEPVVSCRSELAEDRTRLKGGRVNVVVVGAFKRGKSTLLNALVGRPILPMGVVPVTALVTLIRSGASERAMVHYLDGHREEIPVDALRRYVSETENPENRLGVERVEVELPELRELGRITLADTPGSGSVFQHNTDTLRQWLGQIDAALFVVSTDPPIGETDSELLQEVAETAGEVLVVLNKADHLRPDELGDSIEYTSRAVEATMGRPVPLIPCSARRALEEGVEEEGVARIAAWIRELAAGRGEAVLEKAVARRAARRLAQEITLVRLEEASARSSVEDLEAALRQLQEVRVELVRRVREVEAAFQAGCADLMRHHDDVVRERQQQLIAEVQEVVHREAQHLMERRINMLRFQRKLERVRDRTVEAVLEPFQKEREEAVIAGFQNLTERALSRVNELVDEAFERAARLVGVEMASFDVRESFSMESRLDYRVGLPKVNLDYIIEGLFLLLPGPVGRPMVARRHHRFIPEAMGRQLGLIRADLHERLNESAFSFKGGLERRVEEALDRLENAVKRGAELAALDRESLAARLEALDRRRDVLERALRVCTGLIDRDGPLPIQANSSSG